VNLWAVIPSCDRLEMLTNLTGQLHADGVKIVVIDTGYDPPLSLGYWDNVDIIEDNRSPNISRWWNLGLDAIHEVQRWIDNEYVVAVLNDDLVIPPRFVQQLAEAIKNTGAAVAYPDQHGFGRNHLHQYAGPISLYRRMTGYAFALRGSANIRADETLQWWYGDDDIDWTARQRGGSLLVGGLRVEHLRPNETTVGELAEQTGRDRRQFEAKWGRTPW
jgi:hypothetical protein